MNISNGLIYVCPTCKSEVPDPGHFLRINSKCKKCKRFISIPELLVPSKLSLHSQENNHPHPHRANAQKKASIGGIRLPKASVKILAKNPINKKSPSKFSAKTNKNDKANITPKPNLRNHRNAHPENQQRQQKQKDNMPFQQADKKPNSRLASNMPIHYNIEASSKPNLASQTFRTAKNLCFNRYVFVLLAMAGFSWTLLWAKHFYSPDSLPESFNLLNNNKAKATEVFQKFFNANSPRELYGLLRFPHKNSSEVTDIFYNKWHSKMPKIKRITPKKHIKNGNLEYYFCQAELMNGNQHFLATVKTPLGYRLDWDSFRVVDDEEWQEFLTKSDVEKKEMRVIAKPLSQPPNPSQPNESKKTPQRDYLFVELRTNSPSINANKIVAKVARNSEIGRKISSCFDSEKSREDGVLLILTLANPIIKQGFYEFDIVDFVDEGWVKNTSGV